LAKNVQSGESVPHVDGKLPVPTVGSRAIGDVRGIFTANDYPVDAFESGQGGTAQFLLMIGEGGRVMDCTAVRSSGVASLDAMGCQVLRERARFKPATDTNGRPAKDTFVTPVINWRIY
jgi:TonB family protein